MTRTNMADAKKWPIEVQLALIVRRVMRVLPMLANRTGDASGGFKYWPVTKRSEYLLAILRSYQVAAQCVLLRTRNLDDSFPLDGLRAAYAVAAAAGETRAGYARARVLAGGAYAAAAAAAAAARDFSDGAYAAAARVLAGGAHAAAAAAAAAAFRTFRTFRASCADDAAAAYFVDADADACASDFEFLQSSALQSTDLATRLLRCPLWQCPTSPIGVELWKHFQADALGLDAGFEVWIDWYRDRLDGKPFDQQVETAWAMLSEERLAQSAAEINAHLRSIRVGRSKKEFHRTRALFIGNGGAGKTSLIRALHGEVVAEGSGKMTKGIEIEASHPVISREPPRSHSKVDIDEGAGVFTRMTTFDDQGLTVHFWDFGGQVMAHATHQFFLRARCLYVVVLDARAERNANEEAEYWLEHVRAFGDNSPVLLVGNKADKVSVNLDLATLQSKYPNILNFYRLSCTESQGTHRSEFELFLRDFRQSLIDIGRHGERFTPAEFAVLRRIQNAACAGDFLSNEQFESICAEEGVPTDGPNGSGSLLDLLDKLGVVIHFPKLQYLTDYVLNPHWLTYGVYTLMYSDRAIVAKGRLRVREVVEILKNTSLRASENRRKLLYPPDRCRIIVQAMTAFRIAYQVGGEDSELVIPALLDTSRPANPFKAGGAMAFRFVFQGFLPRHVLPALIVDRHKDIVQFGGRQIVWQNGVLLESGNAHDAQAMVQADYHERRLEIQLTGTDALIYLGILRDVILETLNTMPELRFNEMVQLRPDMRMEREEALRTSDCPIWMDFSIIRTASKKKLLQIAGTDGCLYEVEKVQRVTPIAKELRPTDVFISFASKDIAAVEILVMQLETEGYSVWYDRRIDAGEPFRDLIEQRLRDARAVVVLWTRDSVVSNWVIHEANRADEMGKLICLRSMELDLKDVPAPFASVAQMLEGDNLQGLLSALPRLMKSNK